MSLLAVLGELGPVRRDPLVVVDQARLGLQVECGRGTPFVVLKHIASVSASHGSPSSVRHAAPQVDHRFAVVEDGDGRAAVGAFELSTERLLDRGEVAVREAFHATQDRRLAPPGLETLAPAASATRRRPQSGAAPGRVRLSGVSLREEYQLATLDQVAVDDP